MNRVVHFEIHSVDPIRAAEFYSAVFGWNIAEWEIPNVEIPDENRYWMVTTGEENEPGINGGLLFRRGPAPQDGQAVNAFVCTLRVESLDTSIEKVVEAGGTIGVPKMAITGVGWLAYAKDLDGNIFGMMQNDPSAA